MRVHSLRTRSEAGAANLATCWILGDLLRDWILMPKVFGRSPFAFVRLPRRVLMELTQRVASGLEDISAAKARSGWFRRMDRRDRLPSRLERQRRIVPEVVERHIGRPCELCMVRPRWWFIYFLGGVKLYACKSRKAMITILEKGL